MDAVPTDKVKDNLLDEEVLDKFFHSLLSKKLKGSRDDPTKWKKIGEGGDSTRWTIDLDDDTSEREAWLSQVQFRTPEKFKVDHCGMMATISLADCLLRTLPETYMVQADSTEENLKKSTDLDACSYWMQLHCPSHFDGVAQFNKFIVDAQNENLLTPGCLEWRFEYYQ